MDEEKGEKQSRGKGKSTSKKTKVVGTQTYVNTATGEVEDFKVINIEERDANFQKIWIGHVLSAIDEISNAKMRLLFFLIEESSKLENIITMTVNEICNATGISKQTVVTTLITLEKHDVIRRKTGVVMLNPNVVFRGNYGKRMNVLLRYHGMDGDEKLKELPKQNSEEKTPNS